jgi:predicted DNA-binding transcriptional regulator YafY
MAAPIERVTNLLTLLLERRVPLTLRQIVGELAGQYPDSPDAQRATFERDKALLREIGVPIETEVLGGDQAGQTAYSIDRAAYELRGLELDDAERHALQMAVATIRTDPGQEAVWKLGGSALPAATLRAHLPDVAELPSLRSAIAARRPVSFGYRGVERVLEPYGLLLREGYWYVIGLDRSRREIRTFRVDRIGGEVRQLDGERFEVPVGFDPRSTFPTDPKRLGEDDEPRSAEVAVWGSVVEVVRRELGAAAALAVRDDGSTVFVVPCANLSAFRAWVVALGTDAEVLGPPEVRDDLVRWLRDIVSAGSRA